jgi:aspartate/methionine/tyrosine aminotransferase
MKFEPFALERFQSIWENRVAWNLAESGVQPLRVSELADSEALRDALLEQELGYPQTNGTAALRELIASMYAGATIDHVLVTNGGSEANCVLLMRLVEPGDEIVFMSPNYMQIAGLARTLGAAVKPWRAAERTAGASAEGTEYTWDLQDLEQLVTPKTRAICLCNPNNPTGARLDDSTLDGVCHIASTVGAWVIGDEIYRGAERLADDTATVWDCGYERAVVTSGLSKAYGLPGLRIGWILAPPGLITDLWGVHDYTTIAPGAVNDRLARIALAPPRRARLLARTRMIIRANYPLVKRWIDEQEGLSHVPPEAGAIVLVRHMHPFRSSDLVERLRRERGVLLVAGDHCDMDGHLRIGFGSDPRYLESALTLVGEFLASVAAGADRAGVSASDRGKGIRGTESGG